jgi:glycosyltransferase involved in cell wall biosynthesis
MRIAQIVASLEARHGGPSRSVLGLAAGLASLGHEVELLTTESGTSSIAQPSTHLTVHRFRRQWPESITASAALCRHVHDTSFEVIHEHGLWLRPLHYAATASRRSGRPLVISPRGMMSPWSWQHRRWRKFLAQHCLHPGAFQQVAGWHATSDEEAADIRALGFSQPVCIAPNGVDIPDDAALAAAQQYWQGRCPKLRDRRVALFYSRFHPKKRILELIELWAAHAPRDWLLLAVGIPEAYSVAALSDYARRCGVAARVAVFDGTNVPAPYPAASLYLLPSHSENFGLTVAEALAHGLPVVTTDATPWQGLERNDAGRCVPWGEFGATLTSLMHDSPEALQTRGLRGRAWMQADFPWAKSAAILAAFYGSLSGVRP